MDDNKLVEKKFLDKHPVLKTIIIFIAMIAIKFTFHVLENKDAYLKWSHNEALRKEAMLVKDDSPIIEFDDENFKNYFLRKRVDLNGDNEISEYEASFFMGDDKSLFIIEDIPNIKSIKGIEGFKGIKYINLDGPIESLEPLRQCIDLTQVSIGDSKITDVSPLLDLPNLEGVILVNGNVEDISPFLELNKEFWPFNFSGNPLNDQQPNTVFAGMINDYSIYVDNSTINKTLLESSKDIKFECLNLKNALLEKGFDINEDDEINIYEANRIKGMMELERLEIRNTTGLEHLTNVFHLSLRENMIQNVDNLADLNQLKYLNLSRNEIKSVVIDGGFDSLVELRMYKNSLNSFKDINGIESLSKLGLSYNDFKSIEGVEKLKNLELLEITNCRIRSLNGLQGNTNLKQLYIDGNPLKNIEGVEKFENLEFLSAEECEIESIKNNEGIPKLDEFRLDENPLKSIVGIELFPSLTNLSIDKTMVSDLNPIMSLTNLRFLSINDTLVNDISPVMSLSNLENLNAYNLKLINGYYPGAVKLGEVSGFDVFKIEEED